MKERPIIFNGEMVRAILKGRKTQTRRVMKQQPTQSVYNPELLHFSGKAEKKLKFGKHIIKKGDHLTFTTTKILLAEKCPLGKVGDRLWVRETWQGPLVEEEYLEDYRANAYKFQTPEFCEYAADGGGRPEFCDLDDNVRQGWHPSIHMPRWASRITLEITDVRIERLQDISEEDARDEGVDPSHNVITPPGAVYRVGFSSLWSDIYGEESWNSNPWVWVIEFERVDN